MNILSFLDFRGRRRAQKLYDDARELIDGGQYEEALEIGRKLRKLRYTGAFEVEGLAFSGLERDEDAVRVLREGLARAPGVWQNWMLLGSCLSNLERYDEALLAYDRAAACEHALPDTIELNRAIVATRRNRNEVALQHLDAMGHDDPDLRLRAIGVRVTALHGLGRDDEAADLASRTLNAWRDENDADGQRDVAEMALVLGEIRMKRGEDRAALRADIIRWWGRTHEKRLLWLIRELQLIRSADAKYFRLTVHGAISADSPLATDAQGFYVSVEVVADTVDEALGYYAELSAAELGIGVALRISKSELIEQRAGDVKGVYSASGRIFYKGD
ncbi:MAG TPA: hypothetical protein VE010_11900 [Thermoanaerobaculia bacterium]|nr:hypothetical protein [Thermoanaerobaculia bacterium]